MLTERVMKASRLAELAMGGADGGYNTSCRSLDNAGIDAKPSFLAVLLCRRERTGLSDDEKSELRDFIR